MPKEGLQFAVGRPPIQLDFLTTIPGLQFPGGWNTRDVADIDGIPVSYLSKQDLIIAKKYAGRPQDLADLAELDRSTEDA